MERKQDKLLPFSDAFGGVSGLVDAVREVSPQAREHYRLLDQVDALVQASETDPETGFMARWLMLCSLPRSNPGSREKYVRRNGPYTLYMTAGGGGKLPFGNLPRLLAAWVCTEAVQTQSRDLVLGHSLSEFMRKLDIEAQSGGRGGVRTRLRNQMQRFFKAQVKWSTRPKDTRQASARRSPAGQTSGGMSVTPTWRCCGQVRSASVKSFSRRSCAIPCRST